MDIKTFVKVAKALPANLSVLLRGDHGIGKSEVVAQLADHYGLPLLDRRMSTMTEGDLVGLPKMDTDVTRFLPAEFIKRACDEPVFLFLDEINRATNEVMQGCFQLCLDRHLGEMKLHPETRVFAAVNASAAYNVNEMDPAFLDRFVVVDFKPTAEDFFEHAETRSAKLGGPLHRDLITFLKERPSRLDPVPGGTAVGPSRRSWVRLDRVYAANGVYNQELAPGEGDAARGFAYSLAVGIVGLEASADLVDYLARRESRFTAEQVYNEYSKHRAKIKKLGQDKLNTLIDVTIQYAVDNELSAEHASNLGDFVSDLPGELRVSFITNYTRLTRESKHFTTNLKTIHQKVMPLIVQVFTDDETRKNAEKAAEAAATSTKKKPAAKK